MKVPLRFQGTSSEDSFQVPLRFQGTWEMKRSSSVQKRRMSGMSNKTCTCPHRERLKTRLNNMRQTIGHETHDTRHKT
eukprot:3414272-Rhodomonas_salina.1